jgi:2,3,4,5-tetrahydropyridine-2-carboxylate N-succinyltransferase
MMTDLAATTIDAAWEDRDNLGFTTQGAVREAVDEALACSTAARRASPNPTAGGWRVNQWLKKAVLLSFRLNDNALIERIPAAPLVRQGAVKFAGWGEAEFRAAGFRAVPGSSRAAARLSPRARS